MKIKIKNRIKGKGFNKRINLKPEEVMAGTEKVWTYKEWEDLLNGEFGKSIGIEF